MSLAGVQGAEPPGLLAFLFDRSLPLTGGVAHSFLHLGRGCDPARIALHAVSCQGADAAAFSAAGMAAHDIGDVGYARPALSLRRLLRRHRPHVVLCCSFKPYVLARLATIGLPTRVVFWHVAITDILAGPLRTWSYRLLAWRGDVLANSHATARAAAFACHRGRTRVVYLGVPDCDAADGTAPAPRADRPALLGIDPAARVIAYTANFVAYKRHDVLIDAFAILAARYNDVHLVLVGVGPGREAAMAHVAALPAGRVHFVGGRPDARHLLGTVDVYVHPAVGEGFGIALVEAMLAGVPVVAAHAGALPEIVDGVENGLLCAPGDAADLAACVGRLLDDPRLRARLGAAGRAAALARFAPERYVLEMTAVVAEFGVRKKAELLF